MSRSVFVFYKLVQYADGAYDVLPVTEKQLRESGPADGNSLRVGRVVCGYHPEEKLVCAMIDFDSPTFNDPSAEDAKMEETVRKAIRKDFQGFILIGTG